MNKAAVLKLDCNAGGAFWTGNLGTFVICHVTMAMVTDSYPAFLKDMGEVIYKEGCT